LLSNCGGGVEPDEPVEEAAARELFEEAGLTADEL
jgi:8-oxo-dGTP pyrophosphatase MutT (NUDIX family)